MLCRMNDDALIDALAQAFSDSDEARLVARRAGFPVASLPVFRTPTTFWSSVVREVRNGRGGSVDKIRAAARGLLPHNPAFRAGLCGSNPQTMTVSDPFRPARPEEYLPLDPKGARDAFTALNKALSEVNDLRVPNGSREQSVHVWRLLDIATGWSDVSPAVAQARLRQDIDNDVGPNEDGFAPGNKPSPKNGPRRDAWHYIDARQADYTRSAALIDAGALLPLKMVVPGRDPHTEMPRYRIPVTMYRAMSRLHDTVSATVAFLRAHDKMVSLCAGPDPVAVRALHDLLVQARNALARGIEAVDAATSPDPSPAAPALGLGAWL